ncbi:hypothetical protein [Pseudomonas phage PIP]|nr:hypothetical protein [Pseudomonas phage PIP]
MTNKIVEALPGWMLENDNHWMLDEPAPGYREDAGNPDQTPPAIPLQRRRPVLYHCNRLHRIQRRTAGSRKHKRLRG